jgi:hypothetical protein
VTQAGIGWLGKNEVESVRSLLPAGVVPLGACCGLTFDMSGTQRRR